MRALGILLAVLIGLALMIAATPIMIYLRRRGVSEEKIVRTLIRGGYALFLGGSATTLLAMFLTPQPGMGSGYDSPSGLSLMDIVRAIGGFAFFAGLGMLAMARLLRSSSR